MRKLWYLLLRDFWKKIFSKFYFWKGDWILGCFSNYCSSLVFKSFGNSYTMLFVLDFKYNFTQNVSKFYVQDCRHKLFQLIVAIVLLIFRFLCSFMIFTIFFLISSPTEARFWLRLHVPCKQSEHVLIKQIIVFCNCYRLWNASFFWQ